MLQFSARAQLPLHELRPMQPQSALLSCIKGGKESGVGVSKPLETYILPTPHIPQLVHKRTSAYHLKLTHINGFLRDIILRVHLP